MYFFSLISCFKEPTLYRFLYILSVLFFWLIRFAAINGHAPRPLPYHLLISQLTYSVIRSTLMQCSSRFYLLRSLVFSISLSFRCLSLSFRTGYDRIYMELKVVVNDHQFWVFNKFTHRYRGETAKK